MDKKSERLALDAVYGSFGLSILETESPDFVCSKSGIDAFGVEVREFFISESDARLHNIAGYASQLIADGRFRHKDDRSEITVEEIVYHVAATGHRIPMKAIPRTIPLHRQSLPKLLSAIAEKNEKYIRYEARAKTIDLVILDVDFMLRFDTLAEVLKPLCFPDHASTIIDSPYREIYLLTRCSKKGRVCVPIRANLFVGEIGLFSIVYREFQQVNDEKPTVGEFLNSLAAYLVSRFPSIMHFIEAGIPHFVFGSISWSMTEEQSPRVTDIICSEKKNWTALADEVKPSELSLELRQSVEAKRKVDFGVCEIMFEVEPEKGGGSLYS